MVFTRTLLGVIRAATNSEFWDQNKHEFAVYVTNLPESFKPWQIQELSYKRRLGRSIAQRLHPSHEWLRTTAPQFKYQMSASDLDMSNLASAPA